jgi:hypothetical protein
VAKNIFQLNYKNILGGIVDLIILPPYAKFIFNIDDDIKKIIIDIIEICIKRNLIYINKQKLFHFLTNFYFFDGNLKYKAEIVINLLQIKDIELFKENNYDDKNIFFGGISNNISEQIFDFNKKIKEYLDKNEEESYKCFVIAKRYLEDFAKEKSNYLKLENKLKQHISKSIGDGDLEKDLEKEIFEEIKNSCESSKNILYKKGFKDWFYSLFSSKYYLEKIIDMMIETFLEKINKIFEMLLENTNVYIKDLERNIDHCATFVTLEFTKEQLIIWNELKRNYEETREIIIKKKDIN